MEGGILHKLWLATGGVGFPNVAAFSCDATARVRAFLAAAASEARASALDDGAGESSCRLTRSRRASRSPCSSILGDPT